VGIANVAVSFTRNIVDELLLAALHGRGIEYRDVGHVASLKQSALGDSPDGGRVRRYLLHGRFKAHRLQVADEVGEEVSRIPIGGEGQDVRPAIARADMDMRMIEKTADSGRVIMPHAGCQEMRVQFLFK